MGKAFWVTVLALGLMVSGTRGQSQSQGSAAGVSPNAASSASGEGMPMSKPVVPAGPLKITYGDETSEWTPATLAALPHKTITVFNEHAKVNQTYSGVELMELLKKLGVPEKPHGKEFRLYLVAEGTGGHGAGAVGGDGRKAAGALGAQPGGDPGEDGGVGASRRTLVRAKPLSNAQESEPHP